MTTLFRSFTSHFSSSSGKFDDAQLKQLIDSFEDERSRLFKFERDFKRYMDSVIHFDNASQRFFDSMENFVNHGWNENKSLRDCSMDLLKVRNEFSQNLNKTIADLIVESKTKIENLRGRIESKNRLENEYLKSFRQVQIATKNHESERFNHVRNENDQLRSALVLKINELRDELTTFQESIRDEHFQIVKTFFKRNRKFHRSLGKNFSKFYKTPNKKKVVPTEEEENKRNVPKLRVVRQVEVVHDYKAENEDELDLVKGEMISIVRYENEEYNERDEGWEHGKKSDGTLGLFPINFVAQIYENQKNKFDEVY